MKPAAAERLDRDQDRPADHTPLWTARPQVFAKSVRGRYRRLKWLAMAVLLGIYWFAPYLRWDRGPYAPDQAILIDLPGQKAYFFMFEIWPQEIYVVTGVLILMAIGLFLITALFGRVWCGYACPQTVWTDLFMAVERRIEGDRNQRLRLDRAPWGFEKIRKRGLKHLAWIAIAAATGGAWVQYFHDAPTVAGDLVRFQATGGVYATIGFLTLTTYGLAGWARENVCTFMCPYARFQSAMFDRDTLAVSYRKTRGEPRGKHKAGETWDGRGHCVDCRQCVEVCPTGIDIRDGLQMSCISCGLCADACDGIMTRLGLPTGLIAYDTDRNLDLRARGEAPQWHFLRWRTVGYGAVLAVAGLVVLGALLTRTTLDIDADADRNPLFVRLSDGSLRDGYTLRLINKTNMPRTVTVGFAGPEGASLSLLGHQPGDDRLVLPPNSVNSVKAFIRLPGAAWTGKAPSLTFFAEDPATGDKATATSRFEGPRS